MGVAAWGLDTDNFSVDILGLNGVILTASCAVFLLHLQRAVVLLLFLHSLDGSDELFIINFLN